MIDACVRGHARGELASKPLRLKARDPLVGVWNGYIPIYTGCISSLWILPPFPLDTLHREPTCIVALRSCKSFLTTSFLTVLHYGFIFILVSPSLSLSPSRFHRFSSPFSLPSYFLWNENLVRSTIFPLVSIPNILFSFILKKEDSCFREIDGNCYTSSRKVVRHEKVGRRFVWKKGHARGACEQDEGGGEEWGMKGGWDRSRSGKIQSGTWCITAVKPAD